MTVGQLAPTISYTENGITLSFAAPFRYLAADHLVVTRVVAGIASVLAYGSAWNATPGPTNAGGTVTLAASVAGATLKIDRLTPREQQDDYVTNDNFPAETLETGLDRLTLVAQELDATGAALTARAVLAAVGEPGLVMPAAATLIGAPRVVGTDSATGLLKALPKADFKGDPGGNVLVAGLFTELGALDIKTGTNAVETTGHTAIGIGAARYVSDALATLALATAHPLFCKQSADLRYWRLSSCYVSPEHAGSQQGEVNSQPAWAAALAYGKAAGIRRIEPEQDHSAYTMRAPPRTSAVGDIWATDGLIFAITSSVSVDFRFASFTQQGPNGEASVDTGYQTVGGSPWRSPSIAIIGGTAASPTGFNITGVSLRNGRFYGGSVGRAIGTSPGDQHKGLRIQDTMCGRIDCQNMEMRNYRGEIWYLGNLDNMPVRLLECIGDNAGQSSLNINRGGVELIGGAYGNCYTIELVCGTGIRISGNTRFYNATTCAIFGAGMFNLANLGFTATTVYLLPSNLGSENELPWSDLDCSFDNCGILRVPAYMRGEIRVQDTPVVVDPDNWRPWHTQLRIHYTAHKVETTAAVTLQGPAALNSVIPGSVPTTHYQPVRHCFISLSMARTKYAIDNNIGCSEALRVSGYVDQNTCHVHLDDSCVGAVKNQLAQVLGTVKGMPKITCGALVCDKGSLTGAASGAITLSPVSPIMELYWTGAAAEKAVGFGNPLDTANGYTYAPGQKIRVFYSGFTTAGTVLLFDAATWRLPRSIRLRQREDWIEFEWNPNTLGIGAFHYLTHYCRNDTIDAGWTAGTGTAAKGAFAAYAGAAMGAAYVQAEAQATNDAAKNASQRVLAVEQALRSAGIIN